MSCNTSVERQPIRPTGLEGVESCREIDSRFTIGIGHRTETSRCGDYGDFYEVFGTGEDGSFWEEDVNGEISAKVTYYKYEVPAEGYVKTAFSDEILVDGRGEGWLTGFVSGEGTIRGYVTGLATGYAGLPTGEDLRGTENVFEGVSGYHEETFYATGEMTHEYEIEASGWALYNGQTVPAQGRISGIIDVEVVDPPLNTSTPRGHARVREQVSGEPFDYYAVLDGDRFDPHFNAVFRQYQDTPLNYGVNIISHENFIFSPLRLKGIDVLDATTGERLPISNHILPNSLIDRVLIREIGGSTHLYVLHKSSGGYDELKVFDVSPLMANKTLDLEPQEVNIGYVDLSGQGGTARNSKCIHIEDNVFYAVYGRRIIGYDLTSQSSVSTWTFEDLILDLYDKSRMSIDKAEFSEGYLYFTMPYQNGGSAVMFSRCKINSMASQESLVTVQSSAPSASINGFLITQSSVIIYGSFDKISNRGGSSVDSKCACEVTFSSSSASLASFHIPKAAIGRGTSASTTFEDLPGYSYCSPPEHHNNWPCRGTRVWGSTRLEKNTTSTSTSQDVVHSLGISQGYLIYNLEARRRTDAHTTSVIHLTPTGVSGLAGYTGVASGAGSKSTANSESYSIDNSKPPEYMVVDMVNARRSSAPITETKPLENIPGIHQTNNNEVFLIGRNFGEYEYVNEQNDVSTRNGQMEKLWKFGGTVITSDIQPLGLFTGNLDATVAATGVFEKFSEGPFEAVQTGLTGVFYASGLLTGYIPVIYDGSEDQITCVNSNVTGTPSHYQSAAYYAHHQIYETGFVNPEPITTFTGYLQECFEGSGDYSEDYYGKHDFAWAKYDVSDGVNSKNLNAVAINLFENISGDGIAINHGGDPSRIFWTGVETDCPNDEMRKIVEELQKLDDDEEEEEEKKCKDCEEPEFTDEELGLGGGGGGEGSDPASDAEKELFYTTFSGRIEFNDPIPGDKITFKTYNFDYPEVYGKTYPENPTPTHQEYYFELEYGVDYNNIRELRDAINSRLKDQSRHLWLFYRPEYFPEEKEGKYRYEPLLSGRLLSKNEIEIISLQPGALGNYEIKSVPSGDHEHGIEFSLPSNIKIQASNDEETWTTLHYDGYDVGYINWDNAFKKELEVKGSNVYDPHQDKFIEIHNGYEAADMFRIADFNSALYDKQEEEIDDISIHSFDLKLVDGTAEALNTIELPSVMPKIEEFDSHQILITASSGEYTTVYTIELEEPDSQPASEDEFDPNDGSKLPPIFEECPGQLYPHNRVFTRIITSGTDADGHPITLSVTETEDCGERCEDRSDPENPVVYEWVEQPEYVGGPIVSGWRPCDWSVKSKEENDDGDREGRFLGYIIEIDGQNILPEAAIGVKVDGSFIYNHRAKNVSRHPNIGVYLHQGVKLTYLSQTIKSRDFGVNREEDQKTNEKIFYNQLTTGYQFCNSGDYNYYRVLFDGFQSKDLSGFYQSDKLHVRNIALYADYEFNDVITGAAKTSVMGASYSGDVFLLKTGTIEGVDEGEVNQFGVYRASGVREGMPLETYYHPNIPTQELVPVEPFKAILDVVISGESFITGETTGYFYDETSKMIYTEHPLEGWVTGVGPITGRALTIDPDALHLIDAQGYMELKSTGVFTGTIYNHRAEASGIEGFTEFQGELQGVISEGSGSFHFYKEFSEVPQVAYYNHPTGHVNASAEISYNNPSPFDSITIDGNSFFYHPTEDGEGYFSNIDGLVGAINEGEFRFSGDKDGSLVRLRALVSGGSGNLITLSSAGGSTKPTPHSSRFTGGLSLYPEITPTGAFSGILDEHVRNSGYYSYMGTGEVTGYVNIFTGTKSFTETWSLATGELDPVVDFLSEGYIVDEGFSGEATDLGRGPGYFRAFVGYNNLNLPKTGLDYAVLEITGENMNGHRILISGG